MHNIRNIKRVIWLLAVMGIWASFAGSALGAENAQRMTTINDGMRPVEIEDSVMIIELAQQNFMTGNETTVFVGRYKKGSGVYDTQFLDANGKVVNFGFLRTKQRVLVRGFKVSRTGVFANSVQVVKGTYLKKDNRSIRKLSPVKAQ